MKKKDKKKIVVIDNFDQIGKEAFTRLALDALDVVIKSKIDKR